METKLLEQWERFKKHTGDPLTAAILTLTASLASDKGKRTGLTIKEAAQFLGVGQTTIKEMCRDGRLNPNRIGRAVRFNAEDLEAAQQQKAPLTLVHEASDMRHFHRKRKQPC